MVRTGASFTINFSTIARATRNADIGVETDEQNHLGQNIGSGLLIGSDHAQLPRERALVEGTTAQSNRMARAPRGRERMMH